MLWEFRLIRNFFFLRNCCFKLVNNPEYFYTAMLSILNGNSKSKLATSDCDVSLACRHCTTVSLQAHALLNYDFV